ncbi:MAG: hypothetical protein JWN66_1731 [Sphingomonas bacterium]|uniref:hypothetical protein n=1 Tax=Sphingomonas bacterium TaxID=1895847 RepID=UPI0026027B6B|nr:hypothetical protein [Sphingomonas bacterium]MDB5704615.1 hypothetical protein [Sphingomonas bacterium]
MPSEKELAEKELAGFLRSTFGSIWSLESLLLIAGDASRCWTRADLLAALRASDLVVAQAIEELGAAGLIVAERDDCFRFAPASAALGALVLAAQRRYARSPGAVRRLIVRPRPAARGVRTDRRDYRPQ